MRGLAVVLISGAVAAASVGLQVPECIAVQRNLETKSCAEIFRFIAEAGPAWNLASSPSLRRENLNCAAARGISEDAPLELMKTSWNAGLRRWEFTLRCTKPADCVPFLIWAREEKLLPAKISEVQSGTGRDQTLEKDSFPRKTQASAKKGGSGAERLVKLGQTATLTWEQAGLRIVLPVTCLDAGGLGQFVRVRFKNGARILRAEVVGRATLRASL